MSVVQFPGAAAGGYLPPPVEITRRFHRIAGRRPDRSELFSRGVALHLAFGAACGALYAIAAPRQFRELSATAYTGLVYALSYRASLPALGLHPHGTHDNDAPQITNIAGHLIYGLTLAELLRATDPKADDSVRNVHR